MEQIESNESVSFGVSLSNFDFIQYFCKMKYHIILAILFLSMIAPSYQVAIFIFLISSLHLNCNNFLFYSYFPKNFGKLFEPKCDKFPWLWTCQILNKLSKINLENIRIFYIIHIKYTLRKENVRLDKIRSLI